MNKVKLLSISLLFAAVLFIGCGGKDNTASDEQSGSYPSGKNAYVAGYEVDLATGISHARLWKNGVLQNLQSEAYSDEASAVFVSGGDVYLSGYTDVTDAVYSNGLELHHAQASLWLNGKKLNLDIAQGTDSKAFSIYVK